MLKTSRRWPVAVLLVVLVVALPAVASTSSESPLTSLPEWTASLARWFGWPGSSATTAAGNVDPSIEPNGNETPKLALDDGANASQDSTADEGEAYPAMDPDG